MLSQAFKEIDLSRVCGPINRCIYCGDLPSKEIFLGKEHVIPFAISGELIIRKASCPSCTSKINAFERPILNHFYKDARTHLKLNMRKTEHRPTKLRIGVFEHNGPRPPSNMAAANFRFEERPLSIHPMVLMQIVFPPPDLLSGIPPRLTVPVQEVRMYQEGSLALRRPDGTNETPMVPFQPDYLRRFVAKIAHGAAIAELGMNGFEPILSEYILGENPYTSQVVGTGVVRVPTSASMHRIQLAKIDDYIIAHVYLFSKYLTAPWEIVVGKPH